MCWLVLLRETFYNIYLYKNYNICHLKLTLYLNKSEEKHWRKKVSIEAGIIFVVPLLALPPVAKTSFCFCTVDTNFTRSFSSRVKVLNVEFLFGEAFLFFFPVERNGQPQRAGGVCILLSSWSPGNFSIMYLIKRRKNQCDLLPRQPWVCSVRCCGIQKYLLQGTFCRSNSASYLRQENRKA